MSVTLHVQLGQGDIERRLGTRALFQSAGVETAPAHLGYGEGEFADTGHDGLWFEIIRIVVAFCSAFVRLGIEKVGTLDFARFVDQDAQGLAGAVQAVRQRGRKSGFQRVMFYAHCPLVDSFVGGKNTPKKSPAEKACRGRAALL